MDTFLTLTELLAVLKENNIVLEKKLGQNFLIDRNVRDKILSFADITRKDIVVEIGPGLGALTGVIAEKCGTVYAVEKDRKIAEILKNRLKNCSHVHIINNDFLKLDEQFFSSLKEKVKIIGNLPYSVASLILFKLIELKMFWNFALVMIPEDVALKIMAIPGDKNFNHMSVFFSVFTNCSICYRIPGSVFFPVPDVKSVVMKITPKEKLEYQIKDEKLFLETVPKIFVHRRKNILNVLSSSFRIDKKDILAIIQHLQIEPSMRSHQIEINKIIKLVEILS